jgi:hypothetical protein
MTGHKNRGRSLFALSSTISLEASSSTGCCNLICHYFDHHLLDLTMAQNVRSYVFSSHAQQQLPPAITASQ